MSYGNVSQSGNRWTRKSLLKNLISSTNRLASDAFWQMIARGDCLDSKVLAMSKLRPLRELIVCECLCPLLGSFREMFMHQKASIIMHINGGVS